MAQAHEAPFPADFLQPSEQKAPKPTRFLDLAKHGFHDDLAPGVQRLAVRRPHFCRHALFRRGGWSARLGLRAMMPLTPRGDVRIESSVLQCLHRRLAVITIVQGRRDRLGRARLVLWERNTRLGQGRQRRLSHRLPLLFVVRRIGDVTGQDDLTGRVHTDLRVAAVLPAFVT